MIYYVKSVKKYNRPKHLLSHLPLAVYKFVREVRLALTYSVVSRRLSILNNKNINIDNVFSS